jgi:hypothetical protein
MPGDQDAGHDREHSFASFVHAASVSYSLFVRLVAAGLAQNTLTG